MQRRTWVTLILLALTFSATPSVNAGDTILWIAQDELRGYDRDLFGEWVDADKDGCDTRAEVLIQEALIKPKIGDNCKLTGGKWRSTYDGLYYNDASKLDVDHLVPLGEAWRSGAWAWSSKERKAFMNYLDDEIVLNAVTSSLNRSKSDRDIVSFLPEKFLCEYITGWVTVKAKFQLTVDQAEAKVINKYNVICELGYQTKNIVTPPTSTFAQTPTPSTNPASTWKKGATAKCKDGSYSYSATRSGTCRGHGGVLIWR